MAKLIKIITEKNMELNWYSKKYWVLSTPYHAEFITTDGTWKLYLKPGWVTDKRSGSSLIDPIISKWSDNFEYQAVVAAHDVSYSGFMSKKLADELFVHQGFHLSGEMSSFRSDLAYTAVKFFGNSGYYDMYDNLPKPYTFNRNYESLKLLDK